LSAIVSRVAERLQEVCALPVYFGMLYWHPLLDDVLPRMGERGIDNLLAICLAPHFSECSVGRYRQRTASVARECRLKVDFVDSWHTSPPYLEGITQSVLESWRAGGLTCDSQDRVHVVFTAHSLPKASLPPGDPYERQLRETATLVAERLGLSEEAWTLAYQSAGDSGGDWLGPTLSEVWPVLTERGVRQVTLCPVGSVVEQAEILFDLDIVAREQAADFGLLLTRTPLLNDSQALIDSLAQLVDRWMS
jgi:ferrochelatase